MVTLLTKTISILFYLLFFVTPIILWPKTSEIFEFNKIIFVYIVTILITSIWIIKMVLVRKFIFRRSMMDLALLAFLVSNFISTIFSIDQRTSLLGVYSRFNGGLASTISYLLLYWAFISNMDTHSSKKSLLALVFSSFLVGAYGILQHFGIDKNIWEDDVVNRVFSTLGQPNWLAAWICAILPLLWGFSITKNGKAITKKAFPLLLSGGLFTCLIFTKSRSGILAILVGYFVFWFLTIVKAIKTKRIKKISRPFFATTIVYLFLVFIFGSPWTPSLESKIKPTVPDATKRSVTSILESTSRGSGQIRKIVWGGAIRIWKAYPLTGSGVETFAFAYPKFRSQQHNLTAEWDYIYNKAHNEYLNILANNGAIGLSTYLILITFSILQITKAKDLDPLFIQNKSQIKNIFNMPPLPVGLISGYITLLVTNFFGFLVVPTSILFFLYPAISYSLAKKEEKVKNLPQRLSISQVLAFTAVILITGFLLLSVYKYWKADVLYAKASQYLNNLDLENAQKTSSQLVKISKNEPIFRELLSQIYTQSAIYLFKNGADYGQYITLAEDEAKKAISMSPANPQFRRNLASIYLNLATIDPSYLSLAASQVEQTLSYSPTDAKLWYNLGLIHLKLGNYEKATTTLLYTVSIKDNYADAHYALAVAYHEQNNTDKAKEHLQYILKNIDPKHQNAKNLLQELKF